MRVTGDDNVCAASDRGAGVTEVIGGNHVIASLIGVVEEGLEVVESAAVDAFNLAAGHGDVRVATDLTEVVFDEGWGFDCCATSKNLEDLAAGHGYIGAARNIAANATTVDAVGKIALLVHRDHDGIEFANRDGVEEQVVVLAVFHNASISTFGVVYAGSGAVNIGSIGVCAI